MSSHGDSSNPKRSRYAKDVVLTSSHGIEHEGACGASVLQFERCVAQRMGQLRLCERERLLLDLCNYENKVNLPVLQSSNVNPDAYIKLCAAKVRELTGKLNALDSPAAPGPDRA